MLEAHIITSLTPGCQHLILIGDHQQLRPNPTVYDLQLKYNFDVSLFERMIKNGMQFSRLCLQHRMRPEIAKMLDHIYVNPKLQNHDSVLKFEPIKGVERNLFFVDHHKAEVYFRKTELPCVSDFHVKCKWTGSSVEFDFVSQLRQNAFGVEFSDCQPFFCSPAFVVAVVVIDVVSSYFLNKDLAYKRLH